MMLIVLSLSLRVCAQSRGVYLTDLTFVEDGNPDTVNGLINFKKRQMIYNIIEKIQLYQQTSYKYPLVDNIAHYLTELPFNDDAELYDLSCRREPKNCKKEDLL
jgi:hypothetical protein